MFVRETESVHDHVFSCSLKSASAADANNLFSSLSSNVWKTSKELKCENLYYFFKNIVVRSIIKKYIIYFINQNVSMAIPT